MLADRLEDLTDNALIEANPLCDRTVALFGWVRGTYMKPNQRIHLMGVGDFDIQDLTMLPDPCPSAKGENPAGKVCGLLSPMPLSHANCKQYLSQLRFWFCF